MHGISAGRGTYWGVRWLPRVCSVEHTHAHIAGETGASIAGSLMTGHQVGADHTGGSRLRLVFSRSPQLRFRTPFSRFETEPISSFWSAPADVMAERDAAGCGRPLRGVNGRRRYPAV